MNNAIDTHGKVGYLDFGETRFDTTWVAASVEQREWEEKEVLVKSLAPEHRECYFQAMRNRLSGRNFELNWAADLDDLDWMIIKNPTLRERPEDIPALVEQILERANREEGWEITGVSPEVLDLFHQYTWKGSAAGVTPDLSEKWWTVSGVKLHERLVSGCRSVSKYRHPVG